ncbi:uncharacterized protein LOC129940649 [Eupeodes corollae]|uniref:uncharacterized protein LOC129940649 n=2 Tax=Eupeodes corollae TaxID=290404 RepID=UPI002492B75D|nr:uncharacterized protein LOC129940649 [Eupeodes corollae]
MASNAVSVEKLKGRENFDVWKIAAKSYLVIRGLWDCFENELDAAATPVQIATDLKAKSELILLLETQNYSYIADALSAKSAWDSLTNAFEDTGLSRKVDLLKQLVELKLNECDSMEDYVNKMVMTSLKVKKAGLKIDDEVVASLMLAGLPADYKPLVMAVENSTKILTCDAVKTLLLQEVKYNPKSTDSAMFCETKV